MKFKQAEFIRLVSLRIRAGRNVNGTKADRVTDASETAKPNLNSTVFLANGINIRPTLGIDEPKRYINKAQMPIGDTAQAAYSITLS